MRFVAAGEAPPRDVPSLPPGARVRFVYAKENQMPLSLARRLEALEQRRADDALCTDTQCLHLELLRCARRANGLPEYPLPPHPKNPPPWPPTFVRDALLSLNRRPDESEEAYAERMKPKPYVDPYFAQEHRDVQPEKH
jgi:hypothetical protein